MAEVRQRSVPSETTTPSDGDTAKVIDQHNTQVLDEDDSHGVVEPSAADRVIKWHGGTMTEFQAVDGKDERPFVAQDFVLYLAQYLLPPTSLKLDKMCDYPLHGRPVDASGEPKDADKLSWLTKLEHTVDKKLPPKIASMAHPKQLIWIVANTLYLLLTIFLMLLPTSDSVTSIERYGPCIAFLVRAVASCYLEAINQPHTFAAGLNLKQFPVTTRAAGGYPSTTITADDVFSYIMRQSKYKAAATMVRGGNKGQTKLRLLAIGAAVSLAGISPLVRLANTGLLFGEGLIDAFVVVIGGILVGVVCAMMFRAFFQAFALYSSMRNSMRRLRAISTGSYFQDQPVTNSLPEDGVPPVLRIDVTVPPNLRAWLNVRTALHRRGESLEARVLGVVVSIVCTVLVIALVLLFLNSFYAVDDDPHNLIPPAQMSRMQRIFHMTPATIYSAIYTVLLVGVSMIVLTFVGGGYNTEAKGRQLSLLYQAELHASLDVHCDVSLNTLSPQRRDELRAAVALISQMRTHLRDHTPDLGILGVSYSQLCFYITSLLSTTLLNQIFRIAKK